MSKKQMDLFEIPTDLPKPERKKLPHKPRELTRAERAEEAREQRRLLKEEKQRAAQQSKAQHPTLEQLEKELSRVRRQRRGVRIGINTALILLLVCVLALSTLLIFPIARIQDGGMAHTLSQGDVIAVVRTKNVQAGDIVLFSAGGGQKLVRRVIALAGDEVDLSPEGIVIVNGAVQYEDYVPVMVRGDCDTQFPCTVPAGRLFVLSDDRTLLTDSRCDFPGMIAQEQLIGRVEMRLLPLKDAGCIKK